MWKILTEQIRVEIYNSLVTCELHHEEQKGYHKETRETDDILYIDQHILKKSKTRWKNVAIAWIDNKKAYDIVLQSWIINR